MTEQNKPTTQYRWGIFGTGRMADGFTKELCRHPRSEIVAVASKDGGRARNFAQKHGIPRHFDSYEAVAALAEVDVVYVATTNDLHFENAVLCASRGKAVLLEKPACLHTSELKALVELVRRHRTFLMEAMWMRFFPIIRDLPETVAAIAPVRSMEMSFCIDKPFDALSRLYAKALGGGVLYDLGVYPLNLAHLLFGLDTCRIEEPRIIRGKAGVDEEATLVLTYPHGLTVTMTCSFRRAGLHQAFIAGERGTVILDDFFHPSRLTVRPEGGDERVTNAVYPLSGYHFEIDEVVRCLDSGVWESDLMPLSYSLQILETIEAVLI